MISASVMCARVGHEGVEFRYPFIQITSIASFWCLRFSSSSPPLSFFVSNVLSPSLGVMEPLLSHTSSLISLVSASLIWSGIPSFLEL